MTTKKNLEKGRSLLGTLTFTHQCEENQGTVAWDSVTVRRRIFPRAHSPTRPRMHHTLVRRGSGANGSAGATRKLECCSNASPPVGGFPFAGLHGLPEKRPHVGSFTACVDVSASVEPGGAASLTIEVKPVACRPVTGAVSAAIRTRVRSVSRSTLGVALRAAGLRTTLTVYIRRRPALSLHGRRSACRTATHELYGLHRLRKGRLREGASLPQLLVTRLAG